MRKTNAIRVFLIVVVGVIFAHAHATMPELTPAPKVRDVKSCEKWASEQSEDTKDMWGYNEDGSNSLTVALARLIQDCLGQGHPEIVEIFSSAGSHDAYCEKHLGQGICKDKKETPAETPESVTDGSVKVQDVTVLRISKQLVTQQNGYSESSVGGQSFLKPSYIRYEAVFVTATVDAITITGMKANRGNCEIALVKDFPVTLKFGETMKGVVSCDPIEIESETDKGSFVNSWDR